MQIQLINLTHCGHGIYINDISGSTGLIMLYKRYGNINNKRIPVLEMKTNFLNIQDMRYRGGQVGLVLPFYD